MFLSPTPTPRSAASPTAAPVSEAALQQLWTEQAALHSTLQKQFFPKEEIITSLLVTPTATKASLVDRSPVLLVLSFNPVVKKSPDGLGQPKLVWLKQGRTPGGSGVVYAFKKSKPLKLLQRIDCSPPPACELSLITADKQYAWRPAAAALRNSFVLWCVEVARYSFQFAPPTEGLDDATLSRLLSQLSAFFLSSTVASASQRLVLSSLQSKPLADEKKEASEQVIIPALSAQHSANILQYLKDASLPLSGIHLLESRLSSSMLVMEQQSLELLYEQRQVAAVDGIMRQMDGVVEKLDELQLWLSHHDSELHRMRAGIQRIEGRNTRLEIQEHNHQLLYSTLRNLITQLELPADVEQTLQHPDFKGSMQTVMRAVRQLDGVLLLQLDPALEEMQAVKEQRSKYAQLKQQFAQHVRAALEQLFTQCSAAGAGATQATEVNGAVLENNAVQQAEMEKYVGLSQYLARFDPEGFLQLRPRYTAAFARQYEAKFKAFFADVKRLIQQERHDSSLLSFPDFLPGSTPPAVPAPHLPPSSVYQTATASSVRGRQSAAAAFRNAVTCVIPLITKEEQFLSAFFTSTAALTPTAQSAPAASPPNSPHPGSPAPPSPADSVDRSNREDVRRMMSALFPHISDHLSELSSIAYKQDPFYALEMEVCVDSVSVSLARQQQQADFLTNVLTMLQSHLKQLFNRYIDEQLASVTASTPSPKRAGVLPPILKFPSFILKCESVVRGSGSSAADTSYQKVSFALFRWLETVAKSDEKYTDVCLIENYHYFQHAFTAAFPYSIPALSLPVEKAAAGYAHHLGRYIAWQIEYEMKEVQRFWQRLEEAQKQMQAEDIQHSRDLSKHDMRAVARDRLSSRQIIKALQEMYKRVRKHLPRNDEMARIVWGRVGETLCERLRWFEKSLAESYGNEKMAVTVPEVQEMISRINAQPPKVQLD